MNSIETAQAERVDAGSFRDPSGRVYFVDSPVMETERRSRVLRGIDAETSENMKSLLQADFFRLLQQSGKVVSTNIADENDAAVTGILNKGWHSALEHEHIPFISYAYEWTFSMLKDAALLQLELLEESLENGWIIKDSTPFNVQWIGARPVFIDVPSFEPWVKGEGWIGYRQFCNMFLIPLLLRAHLGLDHTTLLRGNLDGISPVEAAKYFYGMKRLKRGVLSHVLLPAKVETGIGRRERDDAEAKRRVGGKKSKAMVIGLVQSIKRLVNKLSIELNHTDWSRYDKTHSYQDGDYQAKLAFVDQFAGKKARDHVWDIGCNTGVFSEVVAKHANYVVAVDGDHNAVEQLYWRKRESGEENILPLVMNLANISPGQGWAGKERAAFDNRKKPDLVVCLALIHHMRMSANIPNVMFLEWLHSLGSDVILEFVDRHDEMVVKLLTNKKEQYADYNLDQFVGEVNLFFDIEAEEELKGGKRRIYYLVRKG